jgi:hypothetical protein
MADYNNYNSMNMVAPRGGVYYVDLSSGVDTRSGKTWQTSLKTVQAAIDKAVDSAGTIIYVSGSATLTGTTGIIVNKTNVAIIGATNGSSSPSSGHCSITTTLGFGSGGLTAGAFACINIQKSKVRLENLRLTATSIDYPVCVQNMTNANSQLEIVNSQMIVNGSDTGSAIKFTTAASYSTFKNLNLFGGTGANNRMNQGVLGSTSYSRWDNIIIDRTEGVAISGGGYGNVFNNINVLPGCALGLNVGDATTILSNSINLAAGDKFPDCPALKVNVKIAVD